ncbi:MAG: roadblock/LC7 domain-containing protein [Candidatus Kariarchaeaceae archaeon]
MINKSSINKILHEVITSATGINQVVLADKTGLTLAHTSLISFDNLDLDGIGAIASAVYLASETQGVNVGLGDMELIQSEFNIGKILVSSCGSAVLCVITDRSVSLGMIRMILKQASSKLKAVLDERISSFETVEEAPIMLETMASSVEAFGESMEPVPEKTENKSEAIIADLELALRELEEF